MAASSCLLIYRISWEVISMLYSSSTAHEVQPFHMCWRGDCKLLNSTHCPHLLYLTCLKCDKSVHWNSSWKSDETLTHLWNRWVWLYSVSANFTSWSEDRKTSKVTCGGKLELPMEKDTINGTDEIVEEGEEEETEKDMSWWGHGGLAVRWSLVKCFAEMKIDAGPFEYYKITTMTAE